MGAKPLATVHSSSFLILFSSSFSFALFRNFIDKNILMINITTEGIRWIASQCAYMMHLNLRDITFISDCSIEVCFILMAILVV